MLVSFLALAALACARACAEGTAQAGTEVEAAETEAARRDFASASNAFALDLYKALGPHRGNAALSPLSASAVLALAWTGAVGRTAEQLGAALHLNASAERVARGAGALLAALQESDGVALRAANKVFIMEGFGVKPSFRQRAEGSFRSHAETVNFRTHNEAARNAINQWAERSTEGRIRDLFPAGSLSEDAVLVLVNAIYFKGEWAKEFNASKTSDRPFHISTNTSVLLPTMQGVFHAGYAALPALNASAVELPYKGSSMRMLVFLPDEIDGLQQLEDNLNSINMSTIGFYPRDVEIKMPKFKIESSLALKEPLEKLGVVDLFSSNCNLTGLTDQQNVQVTKVLQKVFVEVNEKGTEAAAATAVQLVARSGRRRKLFECNHPFLFLIQGAEGTIIFMGRVSQPSVN